MFFFSKKTEDKLLAALRPQSGNATLSIEEGVKMVAHYGDLFEATKELLVQSSLTVDKAAKEVTKVDLQMRNGHNSLLVNHPAYKTMATLSSVPAHSLIQFIPTLVSNYEEVGKATKKKGAAVAQENSEVARLREQLRDAQAEADAYRNRLTETLENIEEFSKKFANDWAAHAQATGEKDGLKLAHDSLHALTIKVVDALSHRAAPNQNRNGNGGNGGNNGRPGGGNPNEGASGGQERGGNGGKTAKPPHQPDPIARDRARIGEGLLNKKPESSKSPEDEERKSPFKGGRPLFDPLPERPGNGNGSGEGNNLPI